jgi:hypothetical protein
MTTKAKQTHKAERTSDGALALRLFDQVFPSPSWAAWRVWLLAVFALPMTKAEADIFRRCTGRTALPTAPCREVWNVVGRRAGKSRLAGFLAAFFAAVKKWKVAPGERPVVAIITPSRRQATVLLDYAEAFLQMIPGVVITRRTQDAIELASGVTITVQSASFRTPRGFSVVVLIADEIAFWRSDDGSANPDREIIRAVRPSLASVSDSLLIALSSPYARRGLLHETHERDYGRDGSDRLVWQAATREMNPTIRQEVIDEAMREDAASAAAEWLAEFRSDLETLFTREALDAVVIRGRHEMKPVAGLAYCGFVDPSGGSADSFTLAIAHRDGSGVPVIDLVREVRPPFSPEGVALEFSRDLKRYGLASVTGDKYAGEWPREQFRKQGIDYQTAELTRSELYLELLPMVNSGAVELLDNTRLLAQFAGLERRVGRSGKDSVDHRAGGFDDLANAAAGAIVHAVRSMGLATYPATFDRCRRAGAIPSFSITSCFLFGGYNVPPADSLCRNCVGRQFAIGARDAYAKRTGEMLDLRSFVQQQLDWKGHPFVERIRHAEWMSQDHGF